MTRKRCIFLLTLTNLRSQIWILIKSFKNNNIEEEKFARLCFPIILMCNLVEEVVLREAINEYDILHFF